MVIESLHAAVLILTFRALEELLLSGLLVCEVSVGVKVELVEIFEEFGADVTTIFLVFMVTGVLQENIQICEKFPAAPDGTFVILLRVVYLYVSLELGILLEIFTTVLALIAGAQGESHLLTVRTQTFFGVESSHGVRGCLALLQGRT